MCSYRAHSSVKTLLKFTRKLLWNLLENYLQIYSKITWKFTGKLLGNLLENYLGIYSEITREFTRKLLANLLEINCEEIMSCYIHQRALFTIRQYRTCGPAHANKWTCTVLTYCENCPLVNVS